MPSPSPSLLDFSQLGPNPARYPPDARAQADYRDDQALLELGIAPIHHSLTYNGGITSMSHDPVGYRQHVRMPPSATTSSSSPGGSSSGRSTRPLTSLTRQVPQFPAVQLVGISTPASSAISTIGVSGTIRAVPSGFEPRKNRMTPGSMRSFNQTQFIGVYYFLLGHYLSIFLAYHCCIDSEVIWIRRSSAEC